ncbi:unnamed protein product [Fusarium graminearum]|nr:unnamed protein product [Fusarium graminearum]
MLHEQQQPVAKLKPKCPLTSNIVEAEKSFSKLITNKKNVMTKRGRQKKKKKKKKKKASNVTTDKGEEMTSSKLLKGGNTMGKQPLATTVRTRVKQRGRKGKKKKKKEKCKVASVLLKS